MCVRWYAAYPLSLRQIEQMMAERGVVVDHATIHRWSFKMLPILAAVFRRLKRPVGTSWRLDETYIKVSGEWKDLYRAVDRTGHTIDLLLRAHRDLAAARRFIERAIDLHGVPGKITIDKAGRRSTSSCARTATTPAARGQYPERHVFEQLAGDLARAQHTRCIAAHRYLDHHGRMQWLIARVVLSVARMERAKRKSVATSLMKCARYPSGNRITTQLTAHEVRSRRKWTRPAPNTASSTLP